MVAIKLPNGDVMNMDGEVNGLAVAQNISASLAKAAIAVNVDGKLTDLSTPITTLISFSAQVQCTAYPSLFLMP